MCTPIATPPLPRAIVEGLGPTDCASVEQSKPELGSLGGGFDGHEGDGSTRAREIDVDIFPLPLIWDAVTAFL